MSEHAKGKWEVGEPFQIWSGGYLIANFHAPLTGTERHREGLANVQRTIACVNACWRINPEAVPELLEAIKESTWALRDVACLGPDEAVNPEWYPIVHRCEAVIAKAQPQKETTQ